MGAYSIPIRRGRILSTPDLNLSGRRARFVYHPVDKAVVKVFGVSIDDIYSHCRGTPVDDARRALIALRQEFSGLGNRRLGHQIGRNASSIYYALKASKSLEQTDPGYRDKLNATRKAIGL